MCGIAGYIGEPDLQASEQVVRRTTSALAHRGPNGEGIETWPLGTFGHRRLSIFDLSDAGRQPMISSDGETGVVFNGAIYNFIELRKELRSHGCIFKSQTDTEVLIHGYKVWGFDAMIERLRGMFAIGLWDNRIRKLFLVRDRLGVKPLLYTCRNGKVAFASTARALVSSGIVSEIDREAIAEYLEFGYVTDERSIYKGVSKLPAGHILEWENGRITTRSYWTPPTPTETEAIDFHSAVEETERLFLQAVERRLQADVPVGTLLSGGVDSSLVCWAVSKLGGNIKAFTVGTPGDAWDESIDARKTAEFLKINHQIIELSPDAAPDVEDLVSAYGEPFACASSLGMLNVSQAVKESATVLLTGDGGDDVFLGYPEHLNFWRATRIANVLPASAEKIWAASRGLFPDNGRLRRVRSFLDYTTGGIGAAIRVRDGLPEYFKHGLLGERLRDAQVSQRNKPRSLESARDLLSDFLKYDLHNRFVGEYLTKVDGATMFHSLEARSPFLDQDLWEFASRLPYHVRLHGGQLKAVLRELARKRLGERVSSGRKRGFGIPVQRWIAGKWQHRVREALSESILAKEGWISSSSSLRYLDLAVQNGEATRQLWYLFVLETWMRKESNDSLTGQQPPPLQRSQAAFC
jgi:asparagine synthase (glutamine-hydrolysing)